MKAHLFTVLAVGLAGGPALCAQADTARPNIIYILADDLGWGDVGFNGSDIRTPNLDRLAQAGARLDAFYTQSLCSPTRAALLTGRYPSRYGMQSDVVRPWARHGLPKDERTLPQALAAAGYETAIFGKWHLGHAERAQLPLARGFAHQYGHYNGAIDYFRHMRDEGFDWHRDDAVCHDEGYSTRLIADECVRLLERTKATQPFFYLVAFNAPHAPFQAPPVYAEPYAGRSGNARVYAGMVTAMDEAIGRILAAVEKKGRGDNTLIIFSSDNGGPQPGRITSNGPFRAGKGTLYEGGTRVAACVTWPGHIPVGVTVKSPLHVVDWYPTLLALAGGTLQQPKRVDGRDAWPAIARGEASPHEAILINTTPLNGAIRVGDWKLVRNGRIADADEGGPPAGLKPRPSAAENKPPEADTYELFDLGQDPGEKNNRATQFPDKVKELRARLDQFAQEAAAPFQSGPRPTDFVVPKVWGDFK